VLFAATIAIAAHNVGAQVQGLPDEIQARQAGDARQQANIDAEMAARASGDAALQRKIDAETTARINGEQVLNVRIDAEAVSRTEAIDALRKSIGSGGGGSGGGTITVDCGSDGSIAQALTGGAARIVVRGTCAGPVVIDRDDVFLAADPTGGSLHGTDPDANVVLVTGHRVTIEGLMITGGRNGIAGVGASNLTVRDVAVQASGGNGIVYASGSSGTIDRCTIQGNTRTGIVVDGSWARITNCTIQNNAGGISVINGGSAVIGITNRSVAAGNTIRQNTGSGINVLFGAIATVAMNTITQNTGIGISILNATATISGGNTITGNPFGGVVATASRVSLGDAGTGLTTVNQVSENGSAGLTGGVFAGVGTSMLIRDAQIQANSAAGLIISLHSQVQMTGTTIRNNASDGIRLVLGAALLPLTPVSTITGNTGAGIQCTDSESSVVNTVPSTANVFGNFGGDVSARCTSFDAAAIAPPAPPPVPPLPPGT
jgi:parallel beta-helix repeat protein